jgi:hypothetical protein
MFPLSSVAWGKGIFVAGAYDGSVLTSPDGFDWAALALSRPQLEMFLHPHAAGCVCVQSGAVPRSNCKEFLQTQCYVPADDKNQLSELGSHPGGSPSEPLVASSECHGIPPPTAPHMTFSQNFNFGHRRSSLVISGNLARVLCLLSPAVRVPFRSDSDLLPFQKRSDFGPTLDRFPRSDPCHDALPAAGFGECRKLPASL